MRRLTFCVLGLLLVDAVAITVWDARNSDVNWFRPAVGR